EVRRLRSPGCEASRSVSKIRLGATHLSVAPRCFPRNSRALTDRRTGCRRPRFLVFRTVSPRLARLLSNHPSDSLPPSCSRSDLRRSEERRVGKELKVVWYSFSSENM